jgi:hypothetical protein
MDESRTKSNDFYKIDDIHTFGAGDFLERGQIIVKIKVRFFIDPDI